MPNILLDGDIAPAHRCVVAYLRERTRKDKSFEFTIEDICKQEKKSRQWVHKTMKILLDMDEIYLHQRRNGGKTMHKYRLRDGWNG